MLMERPLWFAIILISLQSGYTFELLCHFSGGDRGMVENERGTIENDGQHIRCKKTKDTYCFAVWKRSLNDTITLKKQSCMIMTDPVCRQMTCSNSFKNSHAGFEFCCCKGMLCNGNVTGAVPVKRRGSQVASDIPYKGYKEPDDVPDDDENQTVFTSSHLGLVLGVCVTAVFLVFGAGFAFFVVRKRNLTGKTFIRQPLRLRMTNGNVHRNGRLPSASNDSCGTASTRLISLGGRQRFSQGKLLGDFSRLQLTDLIHRGKYGEVWKSKLPLTEGSDASEEIYCVKTFTRGPQQQYFQNERDIYSMTMNNNHPNILSCLGWDVRSGDGLGMLVLEYCPDGSLQHYLVNNAVDWKTFLRLSMGAAAGVAHLHSEFGVPGVTTDLTQKVSWTSGDRKCPIVHRDINSRNMVVRRDGSLLISDMGFAVKLAPGGNRYYNRDNEPENAEEFPLQEVGTVRYMAPEVLEGFVNLRECESSLKQVDVYALALVLWELANRCSNLFTTGTAPPYIEPYWHEVGAHPDVSSLMEVVVKQKIRPKFCNDWCSTRMPYRLLKDTLEESWDSDQEARLSAACILERFKSLSTDWESYQAPTSEENKTENVPLLVNTTESHAIDIEHDRDENGEQLLVS